MSQGGLLALSVLSGICFGSMSFSYQMARRWKMPASHVALFALLGGALFFGGALYVRPALGPDGAPMNPWAAPAVVWIPTIIGVLGQIATILLMDPAQRRGPAAPVFCAMNLTFLPTALYAVGILRERITLWQGLGLAAALGCVLVAGKAQPAETAPGSTAAIRSRGDSWMYPLLLLGLMFSSSLATVVMKQLQQIPAGTGSLFDVHRGLFLFLTYGGGTVGLAAVLHRGGWADFRFGRALFLGGLAAIGSVCGFLTLCQAARLPGGVGVALVNVLCFVTIALIAAFIFKEKRNLAWHLTLWLAVLSVVLFAVGRA